MPRILLAIALSAVLASPALADEVLSGKELLEGFNVDPKEIQQLESGEVVTKLASEYEQSPRELAIDSTIIIHKPLPELMAESEDAITLVPGKLILDSGEIFSEADFDSIMLSDDKRGNKEAQLWLNAKPGDDLNLGPKDREIMDRIKSQRSGQSDLELASEMIREVLRHRYREYMASGLAGVEPYMRKRKKTVSAGHELKLSNEQLFGVEEHFPDYYNTLVNFPEGADCCEHRLMWMVAKVRSRPTFVLMHRIVLDEPEAVILTERHFYVSQALNSLQLTVGWLPWEDGDSDTYMGIATSANSDFLTGFVGKMIRVLGANKGAEMVGEVLVEIRDDLEAGVDPSEKYED